jgi:hypothetical protein
VLDARLPVSVLLVRPTTRCFCGPSLHRVKAFISRRLWVSYFCALEESTAPYPFPCPSSVTEVLRIADGPPWMIYYFVRSILQVYVRILVRIQSPLCLLQVLTVNEVYPAVWSKMDSHLSFYEVRSRSLSRKGARVHVVKKTGR